MMRRLLALLLVGLSVALAGLASCSGALLAKEEPAGASQERRAVVARDKPKVEPNKPDEKKDDDKPEKKEDKKPEIEKKTEKRSDEIKPDEKMRDKDEAEEHSARRTRAGRQGSHRAPCP